MEVNAEVLANCKHGSRVLKGRTAQRQSQDNCAKKHNKRRRAHHVTRHHWWLQVNATRVEGKGMGVLFHHTNAARGHIGRNHDGALASLEFVEDPITFVLLFVAVDCWINISRCD